MKNTKYRHKSLKNQNQNTPHSHQRLLTPVTNLIPAKKAPQTHQNTKMTQTNRY